MIEQSLNEILTEIKSQRELILGMQTNNKQTENTVFDIESASQYLGYSKSHLYRLTSENTISHFKPNGKKLFFHKKDLDDFIESFRVKSKKELEIIANNVKTKKR